MHVTMCSSPQSVTTAGPHLCPLLARSHMVLHFPSSWGLSLSGTSLVWPIPEPGDGHVNLSHHPGPARPWDRLWPSPLGLLCPAGQQSSSVRSSQRGASFLRARSFMNSSLHHFISDSPGAWWYFYLHLSKWMSAVRSSCKHKAVFITLLCLMCFTLKVSLYGFLDFASHFLLLRMGWSCSKECHLESLLFVSVCYTEK